jgi:Protein of unknown function (DUF3987)
VLVFRDELVSLLKSLDREDQAEARGFYLAAWNGDSSYTFDRITRGLHLHIPAVRLSVLGSTQPGRIAEYLRDAVRGGKGDDGLMQRFGLLVWPDTGGAWREVDRWPKSTARRRACQVFETLAQLTPDTIGAQRDEDDAVPYLRFDAPASATTSQGQRLNRLAFERTALAHHVVEAMGAWLTARKTVVKDHLELLQFVHKAFHILENHDHPVSRTHEPEQYLQYS